MGEGTESALKDLKKESSFTGVGQPKEVALQFKKVLQKEIVLFPISEISKRSIQSGLPDNQVINIVAYRITEDSIKIEEQDAYLFTSPSNVISFFKQNNITQEALVIAIGSSTGGELIKLGCITKTAELPNLNSMFKLL